MAPEPSNLPDLPDASAELIVMSALVQAYLRQLPRRKRNAFLRDVSATLETYKDAIEIIRIRPRSEDRSVRLAVRHANGWWKQALGVMTRMEPPG